MCNSVPKLILLVCLSSFPRISYWKFYGFSPCLYQWTFTQRYCRHFRCLHSVVCYARTCYCLCIWSHFDQVRSRISSLMETYVRIEYPANLYCYCQLFSRNHPWKPKFSHYERINKLSQKGNQHVHKRWICWGSFQGKVAASRIRKKLSKQLSKRRT